VEATAEEAGAIVPARRIVDVLAGTDASARRDARAEEAEKNASLDAGRFCGEKDLADCPLQLWMKRNATPMIKFGDSSGLGEAFDQIALLAPPRAKDVYPNWVSIARDGAEAARMGDVPAARAACRGCHSQYRAKYHADLRGRPLPALAPSAPF
jgi:hypothetical protein